MLRWSRYALALPPLIGGARFWPVPVLSDNNALRSREGSMKTSTGFIGACGIVAVGLLPPAVVRAQASDEVQIRALEDSFAAGVRAKDLDAIMKVYVPDETLFVFD